MGHELWCKLIFLKKYLSPFKICYKIPKRLKIDFIKLYQNSIFNFTIYFVNIEKAPVIDKHGKKRSAGIIEDVG